MKLSIFAFLSILLFAGCTKPAEPKINEKAYYHFNETDNKKLEPYAETQIIKFKNENGDERDFKISLSLARYKELYGVGMGFFSSQAATYFYYDSKVFQFQTYPDTTFAFSINFSKWPENTELAESDIYHEYPSELRGRILFPYWNGVNGSNEQDFYISINFKTPGNPMNINGIQYENVFVFHSNNSTPISSSKNVNVIYYDAKQGIVGFDDLDNDHWRLQM